MVVAAGLGWAEPNLIVIGVSFALIVSGLLSSTLHLGHPERAWRALSQWRTSWLSREGVLSILTFIPMGLYILTGWMPVIGWIAAAFSFLTVFATAMIYQSLKPIHAWHNHFTVPLYLLFALATGCTLLILFTGGWELRLSAVLLLFLADTIQLFYWRYLDETTSSSTPESATGLGKFGKVKLFEAPHTESNYLMQEMGYRIGRKHSQKLRNLFLILYGVAVIMIGYTLHDGPTIIWNIAAMIVLTATLIQRWLFFAEAKHTVALYYGADSA